MLCNICHCLAILSLTTAFTLPTTNVPKTQTNPDEPNDDNTPTRQFLKLFKTATTTTTVAFLLSTITTTILPVQPALAASTKTTTTTSTNNPGAAQITLDTNPSPSLQIDARSLPVIGRLLTSRYSISPSPDSPTSSVTVTTPRDALAALTGLTAGHLEVDLGGVVQGHLDVDVKAVEGEALVRVRSKLVPALPFKNDVGAGGGKVLEKKGGKSSDWSRVVNMGNGETYFYNEKTDKSQYDEPRFI